MNSYNSLATRSFTGSAWLCRPDPAANRVTLDSPAVLVMTDLTQVSAAVTEPYTTMDAAHQLMMQRGVRMLLALDDSGALAGIITATDILGEKPMNLVHERRIRHAEILVADVMTPLSRVEAMSWRTVQAAQVGNIVASLQQSRRQHALVVQDGSDGRSQVRGIFSLSQIARQLGQPLQLPEAADSFAEIEAVLSPAAAVT